MNNKTALETIRNLCIEKKDCLDDNPNEVYIAIAHGGYFVRPGENTQKFMRELAVALAEGIMDATGVLDCGAPYLECCAHLPVAKRALAVVRKFFDLEFFEIQSQLIANDTMDANKLLAEYLTKLDNDQLYTFQRHIDQISDDCDLFVDAFTNDSMLVFSEICHNIDSTIPEFAKEPVSWIRFIEDNPMFEFDYLDKEDIAREINRMITKDRAMAANMARTLYYTRDISLAARYARLTHNFENMCMAFPYEQYFGSV
jgi:hypothetical protein